MRREPPPEAVSPAQSGQTNPPRVLQPRPAELGKPTRDQALQGQKGKKSLLEWPMVLDKTHGFRDVLSRSWELQTADVPTPLPQPLLQKIQVYNKASKPSGTLNTQDQPLKHSISSSSLTIKTSLNIFFLIR